VGGVSKIDAGAYSALEKRRSEDENRKVLKNGGKGHCLEHGAVSEKGRLIRRRREALRSFKRKSLERFRDGSRDTKKKARELYEEENLSGNKKCSTRLD